MKFYTLKLKIHNATLDPDSPGEKVFPCANGSNVSNAEGYFWNGVTKGKIYFENVVDDAPIFDYYYLYNSTYQKEYDWILLDAYDFIGPNALSGKGFLVSDKFKKVLEEFEIAKPFRFYESRLMYQGNKLQYHIFHLAQNEWNEFQADNSSFFINDKEVKIEEDRAFRNFFKQTKNSQESWGGTIILKTFSDIFYFAQLGYIVSENLKNAIEDSELKDFEIIEIVNFKFRFLND